MGCNENFAAASITSSKPQSSSFKLEKKKNEPDTAGKFWRENFWREIFGGKKLAGEFRKKMFFIFRFRVVKGDNSVECEIGVESVVRESRQAKSSTKLNFEIARVNEP